MSAVSSKKSNNPADAPRARESDQSNSWPAMLVRWNTEMAALYGRRMQEYCALPMQLMMCRSADDVADTQEDFARKLVDDYAEAAGKFTRCLATGAAAEGYGATLLKAQEDAREILAQARAQAERIIREAQSRGAKAPEAEAQTKAA